MIWQAACCWPLIVGPNVPTYGRSVVKALKECQTHKRGMLRIEGFAPSCRSHSTNQSSLLSPMTQPRPGRQRVLSVPNVDVV